MASIKGLGEIALRVKDLQPMIDFYRDVVGLPLMRQDPNLAFFRIADGHEGHTQILAMFTRSEQKNVVPPSKERSSLDHIAFNISLSDYESEKQRLESLGLEVTVTQHEWVKWRSLFVLDPEGNNVEFVCYDGSMPRAGD